MINNKKSKSAITLIALIITIIILIILAIVSIRLVINNRILDNAQDGVNKFREEEELEQIKLAVATAKIAGNGFLTTENLDSELKERFGEDKTVNENPNGWTCNLDKNYIIEKDGQVREGVLPPGFKQVDFLESSGTQYIDTKLYLKSAKIIVTCNFLKKTNKSQVLINCSYNTGGWFGLSSGGKIVVDSSSLNDPFNEKRTYTIEYTSNRVIKCYNQNGDLATFNWGPDKNFYLFAAGNNYFGSCARIYKLEIYNNDELVRNFIPCYSTASVVDANNRECPQNTMGLYDTVEGKFYTNQGSGAFLYE